MEQYPETVGAERGGTAVKYAVVYEKAPNNFSAYVPDLPGCVATGATREEVEQNIREAIVFHLEGIRLENLSIPEPSAWAETVEVSA
jgi:predicted RNase H-like HicB family nuclease